MNIIVCVKQVPDTNEVRIDPKTGTLVREGVPSIMNPDDKAALEFALEIKDKTPDAKITAISMGPPQAQDVLNEALAMGADDAVLVTDRAFGGADTYATSKTIAAAIENFPYDLIVCGRQAIDGDTAQVGPEIAEHLGIPNISYAASVDIEDDTVLVKRVFSDGYQMVRAQLPCLVTALGEAVKPRYMTPGAIFDAYDNYTIKQLHRDDVSLEDNQLGMKGSPTRVAQSFPKAVKEPGKTINVGVEESVQYIVDHLEEKYLI